MGGCKQNHMGMPKLGKPEGVELFPLVDHVPCVHQHHRGRRMAFRNQIRSLAYAAKFKHEL